MHSVQEIAKLILDTRVKRQKSQIWFSPNSGFSDSTYPCSPGQTFLYYTVLDPMKPPFFLSPPPIAWTMYEQHVQLLLLSSPGPNSKCSWGSRNWGEKDEDCPSRGNNRITIEEEQGNSAGCYIVKMGSGLRISKQRNKDW